MNQVNVIEPGFREQIIDSNGFIDLLNDKKITDEYQRRIYNDYPSRDWDWDLDCDDKDKKLKGFEISRKRIENLEAPKLTASLSDKMKHAQECIGHIATLYPTWSPLQTYGTRLNASAYLRGDDLCLQSRLFEASNNKTSVRVWVEYGGAGYVEPETLASRTAVAVAACAAAISNGYDIEIIGFLPLYDRVRTGKLLQIQTFSRDATIAEIAIKLTSALHFRRNGLLAIVSVKDFDSGYGIGLCLHGYDSGKEAESWVKKSSLYRPDDVILTNGSPWYAGLSVEQQTKNFLEKMGVTK